MNFPIIASDKPNIPNTSILKIGTIITLVIAVTLMHYLTSPDAGIRHVIFRELYFLPIILAGFWFGLRGGLSTALIISIFYVPLIFSGIKSAFNARDAGIATLCPSDRKIEITAAIDRFGAKGSVIVAILEGRLPRTINGFRPILSEIFPAKKLQVNPTKPETDMMIPI